MNHHCIGCRRVRCIVGQSIGGLGCSIVGQGLGCSIGVQELGTVVGCRGLCCGGQRCHRSGSWDILKGLLQLETEQGFGH